MKIQVLSASKKLFKRGKTEYKSRLAEALRNGENSVDEKQILNLSPVIERSLHKALGSSPDLIIIEDCADSEVEFRKKFAYIIDRAERKIQNKPNAKKKGRRRKGEPIEERSYMRKTTHIFNVEVGGFSAYAFSYRRSRVIVLPEKFDAAFTQELLDSVESTFAGNEGKYPRGYSLTEKKVRVLTFFERHFPIKSDPQSEKARKLVMLTALCAFLVAGYMFVFNMYYLPMHNEAVMSEIQTIFYQKTENGGNGNTKKIKQLNWKEIEKINPDIKGWIKINNTQIDYPILWHKGDNAESQYYLWRNYRGESYAGSTASIFIDYRSKQAMNSKNIVLHGHHMEDGSMFAGILKYFDGFYSPKMDFYKKSPIVKISTKKGGTQAYKIFSVFKTNVNKAQGEYFDFYAGTFKSDAQFMNYVYNLKIRSLIDCPVSVNENDQLLTLVTCSYEWDDFRTVVVARKCRDGESAIVDVSKAKKAPNPVWPQCYYSRNGGTRPTVSTFKTEYKKGKLGWYDGNGKLKGSEQLPVTFKEPTEPTAATSTAPKTQPTTKPLKKYKVKIYNRGNLIAQGDVQDGKSVTLPKITSYSDSNYKYTFNGWRKNGKTTLGKNTKSIKITGTTSLRALYKKTKINKPKATQATKPTKPATKPTKATTPATKPKPTKPVETTPPVTEVSPETEPVEE